MVPINTIVEAGLKGVKMLGKGAVKHIPTILTGVGTLGVGAAMFFMAKKAPEAKKALDEVREEWNNVEDKEKRVKADYYFKLIRVGAKYYWVAISIATGAIICFWCANHVNLKRLTSALTAAGLSAKAKEELEQKIKELDGDKKLQKIRDEIDADRVKENPPVEDEIIQTGFGNHMCYEPITGRYFYSNIEKIKRAVIFARDQLQKDGYLSLNDWFNLLGLDSTDIQLCWTANAVGEVNEFDISTSSQLTSCDIPVLVIRYDVNPTMEYRDW